MALLAAYSFDSGNASDISGNGNDGEIVGGNIDWVATGHTNGGAFNDGLVQGSYISVPAVGLQPANAVTISMWVNAESGSGINSMFTAGKPMATGLADSYSIFISDTQAGFDLLTSAGEVTPLSSVGLADDTWHFVAGTYDGTTAQLWVDGTSVASVAASGAITYDTTPFCMLASAHFSGDRTKGTIDDVRVYDEALDSAAINADMNTPVSGSSGGGGGDTGGPTTGGLFVPRGGQWKQATIKALRNGSFS